MPPLTRYRLKVPAAVALALLVPAGAGCGTTPAGRASPLPVSTTSAAPDTTAAPSTPVTAAAPASTTTTTAPAPTTLPPAFTVTEAPVGAAELGRSWRPGCPLGPSQLRTLHLSYWGFDGRPHGGALVVNQAVVGQVTSIFRTLFDGRFPLRQVVPVAAFGGDDNAAAAADDTSSFNCRYAVASGPPQWSVHAFGEAIDVNDVENPYIDGATVIPPAGAAYRDRTDVRPGMAVAGGVLVRAFAAAGWAWGGRWAGTPDYQHFSLTGG